MTKPEYKTSSRKLHKIGYYKLTGRLLGKGNFARVEEADHSLLNVKVAIKIIDTSKIKDEVYVTKNLEREAKMLSSLAHPSIIYLYETFQYGPLYYLVTEIALGGNLCSFIKRQKCGRLEERLARKFARQLISALAHMHKRGVIHRDLKMDNIIMDSSMEQVKIVDFGLSNEWHAGTFLQTHCGSPEYAAPELFDVDSGYGAEVDLWSLGVVFYAMATGSLPFTHPKTGFLSSYERRNYLLGQVKKGYQTTHNNALGHTSQDFRHMVRRMLTASIVGRITIDELMFHPWVTIRQTKMISNYSYRKLKEEEYSKIVRHLSNILKVDSDSVEAAIKSNQYGEVGGMFNLLTHREYLDTYDQTSILDTNNNYHNRINSAANPRPFTTGTRNITAYHPVPVKQNMPSLPVTVEKTIRPPKSPIKHSNLREQICRPIVIKKHVHYSRSPGKTSPKRSPRLISYRLPPRCTDKSDYDEKEVLSPRVPEKTLPCFIRCKTADPVSVKHNSVLKHSYHSGGRVRPNSPRLSKICCKHIKPLPCKIHQNKPRIPKNINNNKGVLHECPRLVPNTYINRYDFENNIESKCKTKTVPTINSPYPRVEMFYLKQIPSSQMASSKTFHEECLLRKEKLNQVLTAQHAKRLEKRPSTTVPQVLANHHAKVGPHQQMLLTQTNYMSNDYSQRTRSAPRRENSRRGTSGQRAFKWDEDFVQTIDYEKRLKAMTNWEKELASANKRLSEIELEIKHENQEFCRMKPRKERVQAPVNRTKSPARYPLMLNKETRNKTNDRPNTCISRLQDAYKTAIAHSRSKNPGIELKPRKHVSIEQKPVLEAKMFAKVEKQKKTAFIHHGGGYGDQISAAYPY